MSFRKDVAVKAKKENERGRDHGVSPEAIHRRRPLRLHGRRENGNPQAHQPRPGRSIAGPRPLRRGSRLRHELHGSRSGGTPNIFETEIHGGLYRGTVLVELDAVGKNRDGESASAGEKKPWNLPGAEKAKRVTALLNALQHLWSGGRQSRFLADISPKFVAAAVTTAKVPLFLESVQSKAGQLDLGALKEAVDDAKAITAAHCFGARSGMFGTPPEGCLSVGEAFDTVRGWVTSFYGA